MPVRWRAAVSTIFFVNGLVLASWIPHIPAIKARHALGDGQLGIVLLSMAVGAVLTLPLAGWLVGRLGSRRMTALAAVALCLAIPLPVLSPNVALLAVSLTILGACNGMLDVSMNAQAVVVECEYGHAIMSSFHGLFSLGGLVGAGLGGLAMWRGVGDIEHVAGTAVGALVAVGCALGWLAPSAPPPASTGPVFARPTGLLRSLGMFAFLALLAEGAMADWSAVYLHDLLGSSPAVAATGFAAFSLLMAAGRFGGDHLVGRLGPALLLRTSGTIAGGGLGVALLVGTPAAAVAGCGLVGLGLSNVVPVLFSRAGGLPGVASGTGLAAVATTGYLGFLAGPPLIGVVAETTSLSIALGVVSACCALIATGAGVVEEPTVAAVDLTRTAGRSR